MSRGTCRRCSHVWCFSVAQIRTPGRFPRVQSPDERYLGDIYISPAYITRQCNDAQLEEVTTLAERLPVLVAHGLCHLMGYEPYLTMTRGTADVEIRDAVSFVRAPVVVTDTTTNATTTTSRCKRPRRVSFAITHSSFHVHLRLQLQLQLPTWRSSVSLAARAPFCAPLCSYSTSTGCVRAVLTKYSRAHRLFVRPSVRPCVNTLLLAFF